MQKEFTTDIGTVKAFINVENTYFEIEGAKINGVVYNKLTYSVETNTGRCTGGVRAFWNTKEPTDKARSKLWKIFDDVALEIRNDKALLRHVRIEDTSEQIKRMNADIRKLEEKKIELETAKEALIKLASTL